jgi:Fur family zinc uptake transcriptional regulator
MAARRSSGKTRSPEKVSQPAVDTNTALTTAAEYLAARGVTFTPLQRSVLELLYVEKKATGAYDLTASFEKHFGRRVRPNTVYRTLDFLENHGLVVHLASTRAYVACTPHELAEVLVFFVCSKCGMATECRESRIGHAIRHSAGAIGFVTHTRAVDLKGVCKRCG